PLPFSLNRRPTLPIALRILRHSSIDINLHRLHHLPISARKHSAQLLRPPFALHLRPDRRNHLSNQSSLKPPQRIRRYSHPWPLSTHPLRLSTNNPTSSTAWLRGEFSGSCRVAELLAEEREFGCGSKEESGK